MLELRDKLVVEKHGEVAAAPALGAIEEDVLSALTNLGYQRAAAEKALAAVSKNGKADSFEAVFREALAVLQK